MIKRKVCVVTGSRAEYGLLSKLYSNLGAIQDEIMGTQAQRNYQEDDLI